MARADGPASRPANEIWHEVDAIVQRFERAWQDRGRPAIDDFLPNNGTLRLAVLNELVQVDLERRRRAGELARLEDYLERYPELAPTHVSTSPQKPVVPVVDGSSAAPRQIGRYRVEKILGEGGFGVVYLAHDDQLGRSVAIKVPHPQRIGTAGDAQAYQAEARAVANLDHPHIVPVFDVGSTPELPFFFVSKFIDGSTLAKRLKEGRPPLGEAVSFVATVAEALHYAHRQGLVHRDIKPGNIMIDMSGKPSVVDFGLALKEEHVGQGPRYAGTPAYMSPEQARGEGHRVDGRSDIFSLGVVFYELLTGRRPFRAASQTELMEQITTFEPRPPRQIDDTVPKELERICLKAMAKRASERYTTAKDLADDLRHFLHADQEKGRQGDKETGSTPLLSPPLPVSVSPGLPVSLSSSDSRPIKIVPKGLRSFDEHDADFFLELLSGPRDREGLPDSLRFWKTRIEEADFDKTFAVGLICGPSGCGKSSLVKAGLLPRLSEHVLSVYLEATAVETETRLLVGLRKRCPALPANLGLKETLTALRRGQGIPSGKKVLIVLDQLEQWLHAHQGEQNTELVEALRQCDGGRTQCIVMVRDDFWMAVIRFMRQLECHLLEGQNSAAVDLFDLDHAKKVLAAFGRAFGRLPERTAQTSEGQKEFLNQAIEGLGQEGKVISIRLALFAEMMKGKPWTPASLKAVGGTAGIGVTFLEETFSIATAPLEHRFHQKAARAVLQALLPQSGADIKGHMRSYTELLEVSGYRDHPRDFADLLRILDNELRLLTPTDPEGTATDEGGVAVSGGVVSGKSSGSFSPLTPHPSPLTTRHYQLTHDYLVHSLREWLTRKQKETRRGRAELLLEDRASAWNARPENRQLPSLLQWLSIRWLTRRKSWTGPQKKMMRRAGHYHSVRGVALAMASAAVVALVLGSLFAIELGQEQEKTKAALAVAEEERNAAAAQRLLAEELSARQVMERGLALCEQGNISRGLLLMSHSLKIAPADGLQQDIRANLAGWHRQIHPLKAVLQQGSWCGAVAFSPDWKTLVSGEVDGTIRLWDVATAQPLPIILKHDKEIYAVRFSPSGETIASCSADQTARLWEWRTGKEHVLSHPGHVRSVAFSPDGKLLATACTDGKARLWDVATRQARDLPAGSDRAVAFSPDGKWLAVGGQVPLWDVATGKPCALGPFQHTDTIEAIAFSPDGKIIVTGSDDMTARLWDVAANKPLPMKLTHKATVTSVAFSPDGETVVTGSEDGVAQLWDRRTGKRRGAALSHRDIVTEAVFSPDGKSVATASLDNTIRLWDVAAATPLGMLLPHPREVKIAAFGPGGKVVLTASLDKVQTAQVWDAVTGMPIGPALRQDRAPLSAAFSPDAKTVVIADALGAQRWDVATGQHKGARMIPSDSKGIAPVGWAVAYSPDGSTILHGTYNSAAYLWDAATGKQIGGRLPHRDSVETVAISPDGKMLLTGSMDKTAKLWDAATRQLLHRLDHDGAVFTVAFSPHSTTALTGTVDGTTRLWDVVTGKPIGTPMHHTGAVIRAIFSPDGKTILTASGDGTARLWEAATQRTIGKPLAHQGAVRAVAFRPDGQTVVTGSDDGTAQVWDAATGKRIGASLQHQGPVYAVDVGPDGKTILTGSLDGNGRLWQPPPPVPGDPARIVRWVEVITGMELDADQVIRMLDPATWQQRRHELEKAGGPPVPWAVDTAAADRERALRVRQEEFERAARAEQEKTERAARARQRELQLTPRAKEEGFLQDWLVLAPIALPAGQTGAKALDREQVRGEADLRPRAGDEVVTTDGQKLVWKEHRAKGCWLDFNAHVGKEDTDGKEAADCVAYAVCYLVSAQERTGLKLLIGSDDQAKLYLNGRVVHTNPRARSLLIDEDTVGGIALQQGVNVVVFKVVNEKFGWQGCVRFVDQDGKPFTDFQVRLTPPDAASKR